MNRTANLILIMVGLVFTLSGCSAFQKLSESEGVKHCSHVDGSAGFWSITGTSKTYTAIGKNVTMRECFQMFNPGVVLPDNPQPSETP